MRTGRGALRPGAFWLADLYENDPRFQQNLDRHGAGTALFLAQAIRANATARRGD